jgi:predicted dehydrogenase/aryl-alcohol dehydrogenase-like predicted oxidoreductase
MELHMAAKLNWGIIGAGRISGTFAKALATTDRHALLAVGSRTQQQADKFGDEHKVPRRYASYEALLADKDVQAVYIATPHPMHPLWAIRAAQAGKHILCEKPIGLNQYEAMAVAAAAQRHGVVLMEAFMYRLAPQTARLIELLRQRAIGDVRMIHATFSFHAGFNPQGRLFSNELGGGGILDVGCYTTSMSRLIAGVATGGELAEPLEVKAVGHLGATGVDEWAMAVLKFPGDILAQVATGVSIAQDNAVRIFGSDGNIVVPWPWIPAREGGSTKILLHRKGQPAAEEITVESPRYLYALEADALADGIAAGKVAFPAVGPADMLGNMRVMDAWRSQIGLTYDAEKPDRQLTPIHGGPLAVRKGSHMPTGKLAGLDKPVSRLVMGVDNQNTMPHAAVMFDEFFECGGNAFDTAYVYGGGVCEKMLGQWVRNRGIRDKVVILDKGAHTPFCDPASLTRQLEESLQRLGLDSIDIYMMHRDNPQVPVGEFIDVLNEHVRAGRMRCFGVSNWSLDRIDEANAYAKAAGKVGIAAVSNNFSLAYMVQPVWAGCVHNSDPASIEWYRKRQMPLMPWSSQARGFFVVGDRQYHADASLERCWYSDDNFRRLDHARQLAARYKVEPINIALAYVLAQPFPTFPLIGPRTLAELHSSLKALDVKLTSKDMELLVS